jgi:hypothetical protein
MVQEAEHLPTKCEALNSNPSTAKIKKERKKNYYGKIVIISIC